MQKDDVIYRQDAIDAICKACSIVEDYHKCDGYSETSTWCDELVALRALPSAQPFHNITMNDVLKYIDSMPEDVWQEFTACLECRGWELQRRTTKRFCMSDLIDRQSAIKAVHEEFDECCVWDESGEYTARYIENIVNQLPSIQPEPREVVPHRNYQYLSDYWCECGWHLGKKGDVKYCPDCGRKVVWND